MKKYYFTFGQDHLHPETKEPLKDYWIEIKSDNEHSARARMFEVFPGKWSHQYDETNFDPSYFPKGCYAEFNDFFKLYVCQSCHGHGEIILYIHLNDNNEPIKNATKCKPCSGKGFYPKNWCFFCKTDHGENNIHADFEFLVNHDVIAITDENKGNKSITNDIEYVLHNVKFQLRFIGFGLETKLNNFKIIYKDSGGIFDGIALDEDDSFKSFYSINEKDINAAFKKVSKIATII